jgi:putative RNA 2'-phosphotransferase
MAIIHFDHVISMAFISKPCGGKDMQKSVRSYGKFLALVLRHKPGVVGLELDPEGWVEVEPLLAGCREKGIDLDRKTLNRIVATDEKGRYQFSPEGNKIRACQGHSLPVDLGLKLVSPPKYLYHGTSERVLPSILRRGLVKGNRQYVHLSHDRKTAEIVGSRRGLGVVLKILAGEMEKVGYEFYLSDNGVWLTDQVPPEFILPVSGKGKQAI